MPTRFPLVPVATLAAGVVGFLCDSSHLVRAAIALSVAAVLVTDRTAAAVSTLSAHRSAIRLRELAAAAPPASPSSSSSQRSAARDAVLLRAAR